MCRFFPEHHVYFRWTVSRDEENHMTLLREDSSIFRSLVACFLSGVNYRQRRFLLIWLTVLMDTIVVAVALVLIACWLLLCGGRRHGKRHPKHQYRHAAESTGNGSGNNSSSGSGGLGATPPPSSSQTLVVENPVPSGASWTLFSLQSAAVSIPSNLVRFRLTTTSRLHMNPPQYLTVLFAKGIFGDTDHYEVVFQPETAAIRQKNANLWSVAQFDTTDQTGVRLVWAPTMQLPTNVSTTTNLGVTYPNMLVLNSAMPPILHAVQSDKTPVVFGQPNGFTQDVVTGSPAGQIDLWTATGTNGAVHAPNGLMFSSSDTSDPLFYASPSNNPTDLTCSQWQFLVNT